METPKTTSLWSATPQFIQSFGNYYVRAQGMFELCRRDINMVVPLFDNIHEVFRMVYPYLDSEPNGTPVAEKLRMRERHDIIRKKVDDFKMKPDSFKRGNFGRLYYEIDEFFTELTDIAVQKRLFPGANRK